MISLRKLDGSLPSPCVTAPFSMMFFDRYWISILECRWTRGCGAGCGSCLKSQVQYVPSEYRSAAKGTVSCMTLVETSPL